MTMAAKVMSITDSRTGAKCRVCRTYRTADGAARLHVTRDRRIWIDYAGGVENMSHVGDLPIDTPITSQNVRKAANQ